MAFPRVARSLTLVAVSTWSAIPSLLAARQALPHVHFIATGGTISNARGGRLTAAELTASLPGVDSIARVTHEQFANVASSSLTISHWLRLAQRINELVKSGDAIDGIVVSSGTDTLEETAFFLHLTVNSDVPVVVVGAMRPPSQLGYEGAANLLAAVRVAASPAAPGRGVMVVLNDEINSARDVTKTDANRLQTFQSGRYGLLGVVDNDGPVFFRQVTQRHTSTSEFDVTGLTDLPAVEIIYVYISASGNLIRAAVDGGAKAIVLAGAGAGALAVTQMDGVNFALDKGVVLIRGSRTGSGRVFRSGPTASDSAAGEGGGRPAMVSAGDHAPLKARILAMLALTKTTSREEIARMFREY